MEGTPVSARADVAVIGGTGFYSFLSEHEEIAVNTPHGEPSAPVAPGQVSDRRVAFLPRHGKHDEHPPHGINYRANLWRSARSACSRCWSPCRLRSSS